MIVLVLHESVQRAVDGVVLAGLNLDGDRGQAFIIVDQIIDLALWLSFESIEPMKELLQLKFGRNPDGDKILEFCIEHGIKYDVHAIQD